MISKTTLIASVLFASVYGLHGADLKAHWDFNELKDNQFIDRVGGLKASGPEGIDLKEFLIPGQKGKAFRFTGKNPLKVDHHKTLDLKNDFTLEVIFKTKDSSGFQCIFWKGDRTKRPEQVNYYIGIRDGKLEFKAKGPKGKWIIRTCREDIEDGKWNHLLIHWKNGELTAKLNKEDVSVNEYDEEDLSDGLVTSPTTGFFGQGAGTKAPAFFFFGELDDFKIWQGDALKK